MTTINYILARSTAEQRQAYMATKTQGIDGSLRAVQMMRRAFTKRMKTQEMFVVMPLNVRSVPTRKRPVVVHIGSVDGVQCSPRDIFRAAIRDNAYSIIVAHNHPSGDLSSSPEDIQLTRRLKEAAQLLGIPLLDHLILSADGYFSFAEAGLL